jgi:hypothetical protein
MIECRSCGAGTEKGTQWSEKHGANMCLLCEEDAPTKHSKPTFDRMFWGPRCDLVPKDVRQEAYNTYPKSRLNFRDFLISHTSD